MKKGFCLLFVVSLSLLGFGQDVGGEGAGGVLSLFDDINTTLLAIVYALGALLTACSAIYLIYLAWEKYREAVLMVEYENSREIIHPDTPDDIAYIEHCVENGLDWASEVPESLPCDDGSGCTGADDCPYWNGHCILGIV